MTNGEILNYNKIIKNLIDNATDINALVKFRLLGMLKQFEPVIQNYEIVREDFIKKYGTYDESGRFGIFPPERKEDITDEEYNKSVAEFDKLMVQFNDALDEILNSESNIEIKKFKYTEIMDTGIPSDYLVAIYDLIEEWLGGIE